VGSKIAKSAEYFGKHFDAEFVVTEFEPGVRLRLLTQSPLEFEALYELRDEGHDKTEVRFELKLIGNLPISLPEFIVRNALSENIGRDLKKLKKIVEEKN